MTGSRAVRLLALAAATVLLVLGGPSSASAQCLPPAYHSDLPGGSGTCPEQVAGSASAVVWAVLVLAAGLWLARALSRSRDTTDDDLAVVDSVFSQSAPEGGPESGTTGGTGGPAPS